MKIARASIIVLVLLIWLCACGRDGNLGYDPSADGDAQLKIALDRATQDRKLVLVVAGGDWCRWCHILDRLMKADNDVAKAMSSTFVLTKVYIGDEGRGTSLPSGLPQPPVAPYFWVLSADGKLMASVDTTFLEHDDSSYDKDKLLQFIADWNAKLHDG